MMGKNYELAKDFIISTPDENLTSLPQVQKIIRHNDAFRLIMNGVFTNSLPFHYSDKSFTTPVLTENILFKMTSEQPPRFHLLVQINKSTMLSYLKRQTGKTVAYIDVPNDEAWTARKIREKLLESLSKHWQSRTQLLV